MLESVEIQTKPNIEWSIIWLHGLGADGHDFEPIVPELIRADWPGIRFVFPHAPVRAVTINGGARMRAWYDILGLEIANRQDEKGVRESIVQVNELIAHEMQRGIDSENILLAGFSQGGAIVLSAGLRSNVPLGGVIALSTYLPLADSTEAEITADGKNLDVFIAHGALDPVISQSLGQMSFDWINSRVKSAKWFSYPMPHSICAEEIRDLSLWLDQKFKSSK